MRPRTVTQTRVTTIHFSWSTTHAKCNDRAITGGREHYLSADPDRKTNNYGRDGGDGNEADSDRSSDEHRQLKQDLLLATPLLLAPERAPRRTTSSTTLTCTLLTHGNEVK